MYLCNIESKVYNSKKGQKKKKAANQKGACSFANHLLL